MSFYLSWMCRNRGRMGYNKIYNFKTFYNCNRTVCSRLWSIWVLVEPNIIQLYNLKPASSQAVVKIQQKFTSLLIVTGSSHIPSFFDSYNILILTFQLMCAQSVDGCRLKSNSIHNKRLPWCYIGMYIPLARESRRIFQSLKFRPKVILI